MRSDPDTSGWGIRATQDGSITAITSREQHSHISVPSTSHPAGPENPWLPVGPQLHDRLCQLAKQLASDPLYQKLSLSSPDSKAP